MSIGGVNVKKNSLSFVVFVVVAFVFVGACHLGGFGGMLPRRISTGMSSKMAKNASKYVRRNARHRC